MIHLANINIDKVKSTSDNEYAKVYSVEGNLIGEWDKVKKIVYHYYLSGEIKSIYYYESKNLFIYSKGNDFISSDSTTKEKDVFFTQYYFELLLESNPDINEAVLNWFWEINKIDVGYSIEILNNLISHSNDVVKETAIRIAGNKYYAACLQSIEKELHNNTSIESWYDKYDRVAIFNTEETSVGELARNVIRKINDYQSINSS